MSRVTISHALDRLAKLDTYQPNRIERERLSAEVLQEFDALTLHADERDSLREILLQRAREAAQAAYQIELLTEQKLLAPRGGPHPAELVLGDILDSLETDELGGHIPGIIAEYWKAKDRA